MNEIDSEKLWKIYEYGHIKAGLKKVETINTIKQ